jgi:membrane-associated PAP2 superfamily phosphatase
VPLPPDLRAASITGRFRRTHLWYPAAAWLAAMALFALTGLDRRLGAAAFFDESSGRWLGAETWWAEALIHKGGSLLVWTIGLAALAVVVGGGWSARLARLQRGAAYVALTISLCATTISALKLATNMDCPRDLAGLGGDRPYVALFEPRPPDLPRGACFPGSHASTGFSLFALYFAFLGTRPRLARRLLAAALALGALFSFGQEARGAHFLSHDLTSAAVDWYLALGLWTLLLRSPAASPRLIGGTSAVQQLDADAPGARGHDRRHLTDPAHAGWRRAGLRSLLQRLLRPGVPVRVAAPERGRGCDPGGRAGDARQGHAPHRGLPG